MKINRHINGFTLIETLLVLVIISIIIYASLGYVQQRAMQMRIDRTSTQMQQLLNSGMSYYVMNGKWPGSLSDLQPNYLTPVTMTNPWGEEYTIAAVNSLFYVFTEIKVVSGAGKGAFAATTAIAGTLPMAYTSSGLKSGIPDASTPCDPGDTSCYIAAAVNIPGQNLNNSASVNFAGLYHSGGCVPVPSCPRDNQGHGMTPQIYVSPVQVSGTNDATGTNVYPIASFTAFAVGGTSVSPERCFTNSTQPSSLDCSAEGSGSPTNNYWRVCLGLASENGVLGPASTDWGKKQTLLAITRCVIANEKSGSTFQVFGN